jgi:anti-sigma B factor antagonist
MLRVTDAEDRFILSGELDLSTVPDLLALVQPSNGSIRLDLQNLTFIDSHGIGALLQIRGALGGGELILSGPCGEVLRVLELTGISQIPEIRIEPASVSGLASRPRSRLADSDTCPCCGGGTEERHSGEELRPGDRWCPNCGLLIMREVAQHPEWPVRCPTHGAFPPG